MDDDELNDDLGNDKYFEYAKKFGKEHNLWHIDSDKFKITDKCQKIFSHIRWIQYEFPTFYKLYSEAIFKIILYTEGNADNVIQRINAFLDLVQKECEGYE